MGAGAERAREADHHLARIRADGVDHRADVDGAVDLDAAGLRRLAALELIMTNGRTGGDRERPEPLQVVAPSVAVPVIARCNRCPRGCRPR